MRRSWQRKAGEEREKTEEVDLFIFISILYKLQCSIENGLLTLLANNHDNEWMHVCRPAHCLQLVTGVIEWNGKQSGRWFSHRRHRSHANPIAYAKSDATVKMIHQTKAEDISTQRTLMSDYKYINNGSFFSLSSIGTFKQNDVNFSFCIYAQSRSGDRARQNEVEKKPSQREKRNKKKRKSILIWNEKPYVDKDARKINVSMSVQCEKIKF